MEWRQPIVFGDQDSDGDEWIEKTRPIQLGFTEELRSEANREKSRRQANAAYWKQAVSAAFGENGSASDDSNRNKVGADGDRDESVIDHLFSNSDEVNTTRLGAAIALTIRTAANAPHPALKAAILASAVAAIAAYDVLYRQHITYFTEHPVTKAIYVGRASGFDTPEGVLSRRWSSHVVLRSLGFPKPQIDKDPPLGNTLTKLAIRGREQQLYDYFRLQGRTLANAIRPVWLYNPAAKIYHDLSDDFFGNIAPYTGKMPGFMF